MVDNTEIDESIQENPPKEINHSAEDPKIIKLKKKTMKISITEGSITGLSFISGESYIVPFAIQLGSTGAQVGFLRAFSGITWPLGEFFGSRLMEKFSRKKILIKGTFSHATIWLFVLLMTILYWKGIITSTLPFLLIIIFSIYTFMGGMLDTPWFSLMGDVVPENSRGRYFGKRNFVVNLIALLGTLLMAWIFDILEGKDLVLLAFAFIFLVSFSTRGFSSYLFTKHYNAPFRLKTGYYIRFSEFLKQIPKTNFGIFTLFVGLVYFGQMIASPFYTVYMIEDLGFSYTLSVVVNLASSFFALFAYSILGKFADKFGNALLLKIGSVLITILPLLWIILVNPLQLIFIPQLLNGIGWTAFNLASYNFIYDNISTQRRGLFLAYNNLFIGVGTLLGGIAGSLIVLLVPIASMNLYHLVFLISGLFLIIIMALFLRKIKEVRKVENLVRKKTNNPK